MKIRMMHSVTAIAQCDQVGRVIVPTGGTGNQMMSVGFALGACFAARSANVRVASENDGAASAVVVVVMASAKAANNLGKRVFISRVLVRWWFNLETL